jgi:hypothetical protein
MRFSSKSFKRNLPTRRQRNLHKKRRTLKRRGQKGGVLFRDIPKGAVIVNPMEWDV